MPHGWDIYVGAAFLAAGATGMLSLHYFTRRAAPPPAFMRRAWHAIVAFDTRNRKD